MALNKRFMAELLGTFWLVFGGCGSAVLAAKFPGTGIGFLGVTFAFGLSVLIMAYAVGHISGAHLNPAVSVGLWTAGRFPARELAPYIAAQVLGAVIGAAVLYVRLRGQVWTLTQHGFLGQACDVELAFTACRDNLDSITLAPTTT